jgi:hypothetical protein
MNSLTQHIEPEKTRQWANPSLSVDPVKIMESLEYGFPIRLIGTFEGLMTCRVDESLDDALARANDAGFDHLPVESSDQIIGLLGCKSNQKPPCTATKVRDVFDHIDSRNIISADAGILTYLKKAKKSPCRLILTGDIISGLVSKSDLQKLPVRALLFHLVTHLELCMADWIRRHIRGEDEWRTCLSTGRQKSLDERYMELFEKNMAIDRLTAAMFADKREVLIKLANLPNGKSVAKKELKRIEKLRDSVAHSGDYASNEVAADSMIGTVRLLQDWIDRLPDLSLR